MPAFSFFSALLLIRMAQRRGYVDRDAAQDRALDGPLSCDFIPLCNSCRALRHESFELFFERLNYTSSPALGNGLRRRIGKYILPAVLQAIEDAARCGFRRSFVYLKAAVHIGVDRPQDNRMDSNAACHQKRS